MENNNLIVVKKIRKQGKDKIIQIPRKQKDMEIGDYVIIKKLEVQNS